MAKFEAGKTYYMQDSRCDAPAGYKIVRRTAKTVWVDDGHDEEPRAYRIHGDQFESIEVKGFSDYGTDTLSASDTEPCAFDAMGRKIAYADESKETEAENEEAENKENTMATKITLTLKEHGQEDKTYRPTQATIARVFAEADEYGDSRFGALVDLACAHWKGAHASLFRDRGLSDAGIYGQIVKPLSEKYGGGLNCITSRVRIDLTVNGHDVCNSYDLEKALKESE